LKRLERRALGWLFQQLAVVLLAFPEGFRRRLPPGDLLFLSSSDGKRDEVRVSRLIVKAIRNHKPIRV
jgi:hypothetical protein